MHFQPVTIANWDDMDRLFGGRGGPKFCWCMVNRPMVPPYSLADRPMKRRAMSNVVESGTPVGILGYEEGEPVAWCSIAPLESYKNLRGRRYVSDGSDSEGVWSIACFFIKADYRRKGMTTGLVQAAIEYAKSNDAKIVEAYPVDYDSPSYTYMGRIGTFKSLGFHEVGMVGTRRHMMRLRV